MFVGCEILNAPLVESVIWYANGCLNSESLSFTHTAFFLLAFTFIRAVHSICHLGTAGYRFYCRAGKNYTTSQPPPYTTLMVASDIVTSVHNALFTYMSGDWTNNKQDNSQMLS